MSIIKDFVKVKNVINSCKNSKQLNNANNMIDLFINKHRTKQTITYLDCVFELIKISNHCKLKFNI